MLRGAVLVAAAAALVCSGGASAFLLARPGAPRAGTSSTVSTTSATTTVSTAPAALVLNGHGWGHGLGMSQWGAYGLAKHGWTYDRILAHYYRGTTLGPAPVKAVRVLLAEAKPKLALRSASPWRLVDSTGQKLALPAGPLTLTPTLKVQGTQVVAPLTLIAGKTPLLLGDRPYRGRFVVGLDKRKLQLVNVLALEAYLKGVVPSEMPSAWAPEALKAQAVAARSYALASLTKGRNFDLYADVRSQVYGGIRAEAATASAAVDATAGEVVLYDGAVATTYFFSTSGGRTASALETTGKSVPYLVSVPDPYDNASPYHDWGPVLLDAAKVAKALKLKAKLADLRTTPGASGRVQKATAVDAGGLETTLNGTTLRTLLELRSTWFTVGWLALTPPATPVTYGGATTIAGAARGVGTVTLEARVAGADWQPGAPLAPDAAGSFSFVAKPLVTTDYRLAAGSARAAQVRVPVVPLVRATASTGGAAGVSGTIRPAIPNAPVQVQRQDGVVWTTVATGVTDAAGAFAVPAELVAGTYRVRCAPGRGLSPGLSQTLFVS